MAMGVFIDVARRSLPFLPVFACIDKFIGTVKLVGGRSMQPTFNSRGKEYNDAVLLDRWSARTLAYGRGDVVVLRSPHAPDEMLTKRVVGLPGDWVRPRSKYVGEEDDSPEIVRVPRGHPALPTGPADGLGHLRGVAGRGSTCSQLAITSVHVVSTLRTAFRVGALRPLWTLSDDPWHQLSRRVQR